MKPARTVRIDRIPRPALDLEIRPHDRAIGDGKGLDTRGHLANERSARDRRNGQCGQDRRTTPKGVGNYAEAVIPPNLFRGPAPTEI